MLIKYVLVNHAGQYLGWGWGGEGTAKGLWIHPSVKGNGYKRNVEPAPSNPRFVYWRKPVYTDHRDRTKAIPTAVLSALRRDESVLASVGRGLTCCCGSL